MQKQGKYKCRLIFDTFHMLNFSHLYLANIIHFYIWLQPKLLRRSRQFNPFHLQMDFSCFTSGPFRLNQLKYFKIIGFFHNTDCLLWFTKHGYCSERIIGITSEIKEDNLHWVIPLKIKVHTMAKRYQISEDLRQQ